MKQIRPEYRAYMKKIDGYRAGRAPIPLMKAGPAKIERAVRGLTRRQLLKKPAPGKWSIADILGHLVDTEVVYGYRYRMALAQPGMQTQAYDEPTWAATFKYRTRDTKKLLRQIHLLRQVNLDLVTSVPRGWWSRYGNHTERGRETVRRTLELIAGHDLNHLDQIKAIRKKYGW